METKCLAGKFKPPEEIGLTFLTYNVSSFRVHYKQK